MTPRPRRNGTIALVLAAPFVWAALVTWWLL